MRILTQYPLVPAALVALCGVRLVVLDVLWPSGSHEQRRPSHEEVHQKHLTALSELRRAGLAGDFDAMDFRDGLGLGVTSSVEKGAVIMTVPEALALSVDRPRSCVRPE
ncbi:unnamed protein product, partial [Polarella glacialis]